MKTAKSLSDFFRLRQRFATFIVVSGCLLLTLLNGKPALSELPATRYFELRDLGNGIYAAIHTSGGHAVSNAGIIDLGDGILIFDTFLTPAAAEELHKTAVLLLNAPVRWVVNSHHHNDHIRGNQVFPAAAHVISTAATRDAIKHYEPAEIANEKANLPAQLKHYSEKLELETDSLKRHEYQIWRDYCQALLESHPILQTRIPDTCFSGEFQIVGTKRNAILREFRHGHTASDLVLYLPEDEILFAGDLVFINSHPYLEEADADSLIQILTDLKQLPLRHVVPGHGPVGTADDLNQMCKYVNLIDSLAASLAGLDSLQQKLKEITIPPPFDRWAVTGYFKSNLNFFIKRYQIKE